MQLHLPRRDEAGLAAAAGLLVTLVVVGLAAALLQRTAWTASSINAKARQIALTGRGINQSTDAIIQLGLTNKLASSILRSATPLQGELGQIVQLAGSVNAKAGAINSTAGAINSTAGTINSTAGTINSTAGTINSTAGGINTQAANILAVAQDIQHGVTLINTNLDGTIAIAREILSDTNNLVFQANRALIKAACIDKGVNGSQGNDGDCK